jgi:hypothetical protein
MTIAQALYVAKQLLIGIKDEDFDIRGIDPDFDKKFEIKYGVTHAQVVNALPIIDAMGTVEGAK